MRSRARRPAAAPEACSLLPAPRLRYGNRRTEGARRLAHARAGALASTGCRRNTRGVPPRWRRYRRAQPPARAAPRRAPAIHGRQRASRRGSRRRAGGARRPDAWIDPRILGPRSSPSKRHDEKKGHSAAHGSAQMHRKGSAQGKGYRRCTWREDHRRLRALAPGLSSRVRQIVAARAAGTSVGIAAR